MIDWNGAVGGLLEQVTLVVTSTLGVLLGLWVLWWAWGWFRYWMVGVLNGDWGVFGRVEDDD